MADTFPYDTQATRGQIKHRALVAKFGDGYSQVAKDGINAKEQVWPVVFTGTEALIQEIAEWLDDHDGGQYFLWTPPAGVEGKYQCLAYEINGIDIDSYSLSANFEQVFRL